MKYEGSNDKMSHSLIKYGYIEIIKYLPKLEPDVELAFRQFVNAYGELLVTSIISKVLVSQFAKVDPKQLARMG